MKNYYVKAKKRNKATAVITAVVLALFSLAGCNSGKEANIDITASPEPIQTETATQTQGANTAGSYAAGTYKIGADIAPGEYVIVANRGCYMQVASDNTDSLDSVVWNEIFNNRSIATLEKGQYFEVSSGMIYPIASAPDAQEDNGTLPEGTYKVGVDLPAGEYRICAQSGSGFVKIAKDSLHTEDSVVFSFDLDEDKNIRAENGQYLIISGGYIVVEE